jgi:adenine C2-methylase RlmN of 23S rRNA A2503 and tRNA A37
LRVLIKGINDSLEDARRLTRLVKGILQDKSDPYNLYGPEFRRPSDEPFMHSEIPGVGYLRS